MNATHLHKLTRLHVTHRFSPRQPQRLPAITLIVAIGQSESECCGNTARRQEMRACERDMEGVQLPLTTFTETVKPIRPRRRRITATVIDI